jgi:hypothetical protein
MIWIWFGNYGRKASWIVKRFGRYRRKQWKDKENMEEMYVELWNDLENM